MIVYLILAAAAIFLPIFRSTLTHTPQNRNKKTLFIIIFLMFLVCALKASSVGIDTAGYERVYYLTRNADWLDFEYIYFENGFILLMKLCSKLLLLPYQAFSALIYAFCFFSLYSFVRKYSKDFGFSLLIYITYIFFVFNLTGLRNTLAIAICLLAMPYTGTRSFWSFVKFALIVLVAAQMHASAYIFLPAYFIWQFPLTEKNWIVYLAIPVAFWAFRSKIYSFVNAIFRTIDFSDDYTISNSDIFMLGMLVFSLVVCTFIRKNKSTNTDALQPDLRKMITLCYFAFVIHACTVGDKLSRAAMYYQIFLITMLPNTVWLFKPKSRVLIKCLFYAFFIWFLYYQYLVPNKYDILPYAFFWDG